MTFSMVSIVTEPIDVRVFLMALLMTWCDRPPSDVIAVGDASPVLATASGAAEPLATPDAGVESVLHLAAGHPIGEAARMPPQLRTCPISGIIMLCGEEELYVERGGALVADPALEVGLPHATGGNLSVRVDVYGSWPDGAWAVGTRRSEGKPFLITVYRWNGDRWTVVVPGRRTSNDVFAIIPWGQGGAAVFQNVVHANERPLVGVGARAGRELSGFGDVAAFDKNTLILAMNRPGSARAPAVRLWDATTPVPVLAADLSKTVDAEAEVVVRGVSSVKPAEVVIFGSWSPRIDRRWFAYLARFDGHSLALLTAPPTESVTAYVEDRAGIAWAISSESDTPWRRGPGGDWHAMPLPMHYQPDELALAGDGDVWIRAYGPILGEGSSGQVRNNIGLFTTKAMKNVWGSPLPKGDDPLGGP